MEKTTCGDLSKRFELRQHEGEDKTTTLETAVSDHIKPGMNLYISPEAGAAICELIRQFYGKGPDFVLTMAGTIEHALSFVYSGLVKRLITTNCSYVYPSPSFSNTVRDAYIQRKVEIENWSLYTHLQRLMAGAMGVGFLPTRSLLSSSMEEENVDSFLTLQDPFGIKGKVGVVKALNPDIAIVHGWAADPYGNTIGVAISSQISTDHDMWGAKASKNGVIVTVEKVVSTDFIREHASFVSLPGCLVKAVCEVPFGAHPQGMMSPLASLFDSYAPDYEFVSDHKVASRNDATMQSWIEQWVLGIRNHEEYVDKLGPKRVKLLQEKAAANYWKIKSNRVVDNTYGKEPPTSTERMILEGAHHAAMIALKRNIRVLLGGIGAGMLASWCAYYFLREKNYDIELVMGTGAFGFTPRPGDPFYGSYNNLHSCKAFMNTADIYGFLIAGENSKSLSVLGSAEIDKYGNINTTKTKDTFLMGSGGANDAANASEVLVISKQSKERFVDRVSYITCPGRNVRTLVSDMGVFQKLEGNDEFKLTAWLGYPTRMEGEERVRRIREHCGWDLKMADEIAESPSVEDKELCLLRSFDPERLILDK